MTSTLILLATNVLSLALVLHLWHANAPLRQLERKRSHLIDPRGRVN